MKVHDRNTSEYTDRYKAMTPEVRTLFLEKLNKDETNFLKPFCIVMMFAGLRVGEAIALKWKDFNPETKTLKVDRAITEVPKFDSNGNVIKRITVVGSTKTLCSVREIPVTDIIAGIHFHSLRHTFSNMLFEINENPKAIQQLLVHRDVKTTVHTKNRRTHKNLILLVKSKHSCKYKILKNSIQK